MLKTSFSPDHRRLCRSFRWVQFTSKSTCKTEEGTCPRRPPRGSGAGTDLLNNTEAAFLSEQDGKRDNNVHLGQKRRGRPVVKTQIEAVSFDDCSPSIYWEFDRLRSTLSVLFALGKHFRKESQKHVPVVVS